MNNLDRLFATLADTAVSLLSQQGDHFSVFKILRNRNLKANQNARIISGMGSSQQVDGDTVRFVAADEITAAFAVQVTGPSKQQLQVIVELRHRTDGRS